VKPPYDTNLIKMDPQLLRILASVLLGWFLAQFSGLYKDWSHRRKVKKCLLEELSELQSELERTLLFFTRKLQIHALKGIEFDSIVRLSNHIFKNYYKDAVLGLNKHQRISFQMIHTMVDGINSEIEEYEELTFTLHKKLIHGGPSGLSELEGEEWGKNVIGKFKSVASTLWYIKYHLSHPELPDLSLYTKEHEAYLKYLEGVENNVNEILEAGKKLDRQKFEKIYDPEIFVKKFLNA
jgi:hypothetical protein